MYCTFFSVVIMWLWDLTLHILIVLNNLIVCDTVGSYVLGNFSVYFIAGNSLNSYVTASFLQVYIEPITGCKFFSMPEVLRHLESVKNRNSECERKTTPTETSKYEGTRKVSTKRERETTERVCMALNKSCSSILKLNAQYCHDSIKRKCHLLGY